VVLAGLRSVEIDRARLEFAQLLLEDLRRIDHQRRDIRRRLATMVGASKTRLTDVCGVGRSSPLARSQRRRHRGHRWWRARPRVYGAVDFTVLANAGADAIQSVAFPGS
jgi:hypothetical protein